MMRGVFIWSVLITASSLAGQEPPSDPATEPPSESAEAPPPAEMESAETKGPAGVRLKWVSARRGGAITAARPSGTPLRSLFEWGRLATDFEKTYKQRCEEKDWSGLKFCHGMRVEGEWQVDFGDRGWPANLGFFDGKFFQFLVLFDSDADFDFIEATMARALGAPTSDERSTIQNRMGANFDQRKIRWLGGDVSVVLEKRSGKVDQGTLIVMYMPLASGFEGEKGGDAPF